MILVDMDPNTEGIERVEQLLYCGMTRAKVQLGLVANSENSSNQRFLQDSD